MRLTGLFHTGLHEKRSNRGHDFVVQRWRWSGLPIEDTWVCLRCGREYSTTDDLDMCPRRDRS